jgi:hypothetical protein
VDTRLAIGHLLPEERNLAFQKGQVGLDHRRESGSHLGRPCRLLVHEGDSSSSPPSCLPPLNDYGIGNCLSHSATCSSTSSCFSRQLSPVTSSHLPSA